MPVYTHEHIHMHICKYVCTYIYTLAHTNISVDVITGWQRPIGCLKLQVSFRQRATNYRAQLRKMTYKD